MQEQLLMRHWVAHHETFSRDLHDGITTLARAVRNSWYTRFGIGQAYERDAQSTERSGICRALLAGLAASVMATALVSGTAFLMLPAGAAA